MIIAFIDSLEKFILSKNEQIFSKEFKFMLIQILRSIPRC